MELAEDGAYDCEAGENGRRYQPVAADSYIECTWEILDSADRGRGESIPSRASSKQCLGSQWLVKITTLWPRF